MRDTKTGVEIWDLDENGIRCAIAVNGRVRYVGSRDECRRRAKILTYRPDREYEDWMLARALRASCKRGGGT